MASISSRNPVDAVVRVERMSVQDRKQLAEEVHDRQPTRVRQLRTQLHDFIDLGYKTCPYKRLSCCD